MIEIRRAVVGDVETIVRLANAGGPGGVEREKLPAVLPPVYAETFARIAADPAQELMVATEDGAVVGTFHLTFLTSLAARGRRDLQVEAVHVAASHRNRGIGARMMEHALERARAEGCRRVQLTTDKARRDAHRFYERLGFRATHEGMKLALE